MTRKRAFLLLVICQLFFIGPAHAAGLPAPPAGYTPRDSSWEIFQSGRLQLTCHRTGNFANFFGHCAGGDCMCEPGIDQTASLMVLYNNQDWRGIANLMLYQLEQRQGLDPADFYYVMLANAARNLGYRDAALNYYQKARSTGYSCLRYGFPNDGRTCGGATNFRQSWIENASLQLSREIEQEQAEAAAKAREEAEQARKEAKVKELRSRYPADWVDAIMRSEVLVGFTKEAVRASLGNPEKILSTPDGSEMWTYESRRVVFLGGKVASVSK